MYRRTIISPGGEYVAAEFFTGSNLKVVVVDIERDIRRNVLTIGEDHEDAWISQLLWADSNSLLITIDKRERIVARKRESVTYVVELNSSEGELRRQFYEVGVRGSVIDPLPAVDGKILYSPTSDPRSVYRINLSDLPRYSNETEKDLSESQFADEMLVAHLDEEIIQWLSDAEGEVRCAISVSIDPVELQVWYRPDKVSKWSIAFTQSDPQRFLEMIPLGINRDGNKLLVATDRDRDRYGLFEYDPINDQLGDLLYEHPTAQIVDVIYDYSGSRLLGATYLESGVERYAYLDGGESHERDLLRKAFPQKNVSTTSISRDQRRRSVFVSNPDSPGIFYHFDMDSGQPTEIGRVAPWLDDNVLAKVQAFKVKSSDGVEVDAFLAHPPLAEELPPLVVMPHGGPVGIMDLRTFDPLVQYLARSGFAVLQVNYRGSGGYGRAFEESGYRQWGRGIEDDIDAAVEHVMAQGSFATDRMCVVGASYGGYSALMSVIRHPTRYRCAATLSGVTDIALMFNSSDWASSEPLREKMVEVMGDPDLDYDELRNYSPVYRSSAIRVPIYLAHGIDDRRVDVDHAYRLKAMLDLHETPVRWELMQDTGHEFPTRDDAIRYYVNLRRFLADHLQE
jgi:dipeptidyl aminopeptidase/acylaminoacyl peptidase